MWFYYLIPIVIHLMFLPFWFLPQKGATVTLLEMVMGTIVIPVYLIIINFKFADKINMGKFTILLLLMIGITVAGHLIGYFNWGISTGNLFSPDSETLLIIRMQIIASTIIVTVGWIIVCLVKSRMK